MATVCSFPARRPHPPLPLYPSYPPIHSLTSSTSDPQFLRSSLFVEIFRTAQSTSVDRASPSSNADVKERRHEPQVSHCNSAASLLVSDRVTSTVCRECRIPCSLHNWMRRLHLHACTESRLCSSPCARVTVGSCLLVSLFDVHALNVILSRQSLAFSGAPQAILAHEQRTLDGNRVRTSID